MDYGLEHERAKVADAANYLDTAYPGWAEKIDTNKLDMIDPNLCVVGQTIGNGDEQNWNRVRLDCQARGLNVAGVFSGYDDLWLEEIAARTSKLATV